MFQTSFNTSISRFGRTHGNGSVNHSSRTALSLDDVRRIAPSVFAEQKHDSRSDRYSYIPTSEVLTGLMKEGFRPYAIMQGGSRDEAKRDFTKHLIRLRHDSQELAVGGTHNEIVLLNSHDGTSAYRLMAGVFRMVCGNGMVVAESMVDDIRIKHSGNVQSKVIDGCCELLAKLPEVSDSVKEMDSLRLTIGEQMAFARASLVARYGDDVAPITADQVLTVKRREDAVPTIWNTLNTTQESLIRGGLGYIQRDEAGRRKAYRRTREVNGIDQNTNVNRALWALAEEMKKLKTNG